MMGKKKKLIFMETLYTTFSNLLKIFVSIYN